MRRSLWLAVATALSASPALALDLELHGPSVCPSKSDVRGALRRVAPEVLDSAGELRLELFSSDDAVTAIWQGGGLEHRRVLAARSSTCRELAEAVALLARSWFAEVAAGLPPVPEPERSPMATPPAALTAEPVLPSTSVQPEVPPAAKPPAAAAVPISTPSTSPPVAQLSPEAAAPPPPLDVLPPLAPGVATPSEPPLPSTHQHRLSLLLSGGGSLGGPLGGQGSAAIGYAFLPRWQALVQATLQSAFTESLGPGTITASRTAFTALAEFELWRGGRFALDADLGPRVEIWRLTPKTYSVLRPGTVAVPGGTLGLRGRIGLLWRLFAFASVDGAVLASPALQVDNLQPDTVTPSYFWAHAEAGLGVWIW